MNLKINDFLKGVRFYTVVVIAAFVFVIVLRVFVVTSIIRIPSGSMEPSVMSGDYIIVTKQVPGPRVYKDVRQIRVNGKVQTKRLKGIRKVRRNDVLFFNFPYSDGWDKINIDWNSYYLKRCVALPGDTFSIENGIYKVANCPDSLGCVFLQRELSHISQHDIPPDIWTCLLSDTVHYQWNIKNFGPLYVPVSGATLFLDSLNFRIYKNLIEYETDRQLSVHNGSVYLEDDIIQYYTFKLNYYFMAGDFIFNSGDSPYWGLLPEDCIIGKAILVCWSTDLNTGKIQWKRFFKKIG